MTNPAIHNSEPLSMKVNIPVKMNARFKDVPGGFPKSDLLAVTVALIHVAAQRFLTVLVVLTPEQYNKVVFCQLQRQLALWL